MKLPFLRYALLSCSVLCLNWAASAQSYSLDSSTIAGGGGSAAGSVYSITGTIGQPLVGEITNANYSVQSGFWGVWTSISTPSAPLRIFRTATNAVVVAWPANLSGYSLRQSPDVNASNWSSVTNSVTVLGDENQVIIPNPVGSRFFRLAP